MAEQAIDYAALAKQAGAVPSPDVATVPPAAVGVDYEALAKAAGAVSSAPPQAPSAGTWEDRGIGGKVWHPASGVTERNREDNSLLGMPPEFAAISGLAVARAVGAPALSAAARAVAGVKAVAGQALPQVKYEVTKTALEKFGVPSALAIPVALMVSGYKNPKKAPVGGPPSSVPPPMVETAQETMARRMASGPSVEPVASGPVAPAPAVAAPAPAGPPVLPTAPPSPQSVSVGPSPSARPPVNAYPDQAALNAEAIAARRATYQARLASQPPPAPVAQAPVATPNVKLTAAETKALMDLVNRGIPGPEAMQSILTQRELAARLGLSVPTAAQTRFPKGMRGKS